VEVAKFQMELGYATFSYPEPILQAVNRAWRGSRDTGMGCVKTADQNLASEREQNAARGFHWKIRNLKGYGNIYFFYFILKNF
jgi:hypothetical protein